MPPPLIALKDQIWHGVGNAVGPVTPAAEPPDPSGLEIRRILLASEGRAIPNEAIQFAVRLAEPRRAAVDVAPTVVLLPAM